MNDTGMHVRLFTLLLIAMAALPMEPVRARAQATIQGRSKTHLYVYCTFRPQAPSCRAAYREALRDPSPDALSVKDAYEGYGRYVLSAKQGLTARDRKFLKQNNIALPPDMAASDLKGLHAVINDPEIRDASQRLLKVNGFLGRAVEAELYCGFNACEEHNNRTAGSRPLS